MDDKDREALERALEQARQESPDRAEQLDSIIADGDWLHAARLAATIRQYRSLNLNCGQSVPMNGDTQPDRFPEAAELLEEMLAAGLSRYEPDPLAGLRATQNKNAPKGAHSEE